MPLPLGYDRMRRTGLEPIMPIRAAELRSACTTRCFRRVSNLLLELIAQQQAKSQSKHAENASTTLRLRSGHSGRPGTLPGVAVIRTRIAQAPFPCPFCGDIVHVGSVISQVISGTTVSTGCLDCEWAAVNGVLPSRARKAKET